MVIPFKITVEWIIIAVLAILLLLKSCGSEATCPPATVETRIEERIVTTVDSSVNAEIKNQQPEKIPVIETPTKIKRIVGKVQENDRDKVKMINRYLDTTHLEGAVIFSEILSEGRILEQNFKAEIEHTEKTITTTKTIIKQPGGLFLSPGFDYSPAGGVEAVESSLTYIKGNWGASAGAYYNFRRMYQAPGDPGSLGLKIKIHFKL